MRCAGHERLLACSSDPTRVFCTQSCNGTLDCSHSTCKARCGDCQAIRKKIGDPSAHKSHAHGKDLACGHVCEASSPFSAHPFSSCIFSSDSISLSLLCRAIAKLTSKLEFVLQTVRNLVLALAVTVPALTLATRSAPDACSSARTARFPALQ
jgi:hypothetical protein